MSQAPFIPLPLPPVQNERGYNKNYILHWNQAGLELNRVAHSVGGPQTGPPISARALGMLQLAIHDAYFAIRPSTSFSTFLTAGNVDDEYHLPDLNEADNSSQAVSGTAITMLSLLYLQGGPNISNNATAQLRHIIELFTKDAPDHIDQNSRSYQFGAEVAVKLFQLLFHTDGANARNYKPKPGAYKFDDEPTHPVVLVPVDPNNPNGPQKPIRQYHAPYYGAEVKRLATQTEHMIADPPGIRSARSQDVEYDDSIADIIRMGGASTLNSTKRSPSQTAKGHFWACDGSNLIGTPPRLYNQIVRNIAFRYRQAEDIQAEVNNADFARLFALANTAMTDAGTFAWKEKWDFEFWRPLSGVREDGRPDHGDPFWLSLGAPATNTNDAPFKPPFPAYPSGHATFGGAVFQIVRHYYNGRQYYNGKFDTWNPNEPDKIAFEFVSEELNGISRDLRQKYDPTALITDQPGIVRTKIKREFSSLWEAIFENAVSRIFIGVHWRFDAAAAKDIMIPTDTKDIYATDKNGASLYQNVEDIRYETMGTRQGSDGFFPVGGIPLGMNIADEIWNTGLRPTPKDKQPVPVKAGLEGPEQQEQVAMEVQQGPP